MTPADYQQAAEELETILQLFRRKETQLRVSEIRVRANLEAVRAELLKMALAARDETRRMYYAGAGAA